MSGGEGERIPCAASPALLLHSAFSHPSRGAKHFSESLREPEEQGGLGRMHQDPAWHQNAAPEYREGGPTVMWFPYYFCPKYTKCWLLKSARNNTSPKMPFLTWEFAVKHWRDAFLPVMMMPLQHWNLGAKKNPIFWLLLITSPHFKEIFICLTWKISQAVFIRRSFVCQQWILLYYWKESKAKVPACTVNLSKQKMFLKKLRHYFYNKPQPNSKLNK